MGLIKTKAIKFTFALGDKEDSIFL